MRIGFGYDIHKLVVGEYIILGGIKIPFDKKLSGHSDADVLIHSICDALLGAMGEGDLGMHFPDTDSNYKDISSMILLSKVKDMLFNKGYHVVNLDITLVMEKPKISIYKRQIEENIKKFLNINDCVNVKATTNEKIDTIGKNEAIACFCVVLIDL